MLIRAIMTFYRILAITMILTPMVLNIINEGEIIYSLLYLPLLLLALTVFFIFVDKKLEQKLSILFHHKQIPLLRLPRTILKSDLLKPNNKLNKFCKC